VYMESTRTVFSFHSKDYAFTLNILKNICKFSKEKQIIIINDILGYT
jgi:hypothetical protein